MALGKQFPFLSIQKVYLNPKQTSRELLKSLQGMKMSIYPFLSMLYKATDI